ncbi:ADP-ribosylglycohydrolase [Paraburkholderia hospita]|uniref:ADP-ribosylglycohydrolase n=1 Tax=Paraburkholderia hospita TaxID=169430 RepID=A0ABP2PL57_9BURK|nr:ADP-ribosylglycohydrolase family protein [Paraburkholderia hospita]EIM98552.1 ADP-ribosylglycohydrolase [Paraburkholderia hospita]OUL86623.1 hypothetical protein CA602_15435 [Paraburkholderia hospita]
MSDQNNFTALTQHAEVQAELGGLIGLLVGDAVGAAYEFRAPELIPAHDQIEMITPADFRRSHAGVPPGTWTDDGAQTLCLLASLLERGQFRLTDFTARLLKWLDHGYMAVDGHVFDVGIQTCDALDQIRDGASALESGGRLESDNGNGSLMRVLPLALWHSGTDEALVKEAGLQSLPTHAHPRSLVACAFYCLVARGYLRKLEDPWSWADERLEAIYGAWPNLQEKTGYLRELEIIRAFPRNDQARGTGYVVDTLWSAKEALHDESFQDVVRAAIRFGHDTDTTAAVAGGLAGIRFGLSGIPGSWLAALRGYDLVASLLASFVAHTARTSGNN